MFKIKHHDNNQVKMITSLAVLLTLIFFMPKTPMLASSVIIEKQVFSTVELVVHVYGS